MSERDTGANVSEDKPKTMSKFKRRISRILGKDDVKRATQAEPSAAAAATPAVVDTPADPTGPSKPTDGAATNVPEKTTKAKPATTPMRPKSAMSAAEHAKVQEEKVRALFAKYNVTLEVGEWTPPFKSDVPRVEKKIRMRVHRTCHRCRTQFGVDKVCTNCNHGCCKKCPRYPIKKVDHPKAKEGATPASKADPQLLKKPVTQRTRMICHKCQTPFKSKSKQCGSCQHERCASCQREVPKGDSAAGGGAGHPLPRSFIKWTCHQCQNVHRDPENPCLKCGHDKCDQCSKEKVQRAPPPPSSSGAKTKDLEERMKKLGVSSQATAA